MFEQFRRKFEYQPKTLEMNGYEFVGYLKRTKESNAYFARCVPRGEVVTIEQVPLKSKKSSQPFWKWIEHPNALRLLHYFCDDRFAYLVRKEFNLTTASNYLLSTGDSNLREKCIQRWSNQSANCMDYLQRHGFYHNGFDWNIVFLSGNRIAFLGGMQHLVHVSSKAEVGLGDLKYCPPEGLKSGKIEQGQLEAAVSWRFGAHLLEALTNKLISGPKMSQFPGDKKIPSKRRLHKNVVDNQNCLVETLGATGLPPTLQSALLEFLRMNPPDRLTVGRALASVDWFAEDYFTRLHRVENAPCKCGSASELKPKVHFQEDIKTRPIKTKNASTSLDSDLALPQAPPSRSFRTMMNSKIPTSAVSHQKLNVSGEDSESQHENNRRKLAGCLRKPQSSGPEERLIQSSKLQPIVYRGPHLNISRSSTTTSWPSPPRLQRGPNAVPCKDPVGYHDPWADISTSRQPPQGIDKTTRHTTKTPFAVNVPVKWGRQAGANKDLDLGQARRSEDDDASIAVCCSGLSTRLSSLVSIGGSSGKAKSIRMIITKKVPHK